MHKLTASVLLPVNFGLTLVSSGVDTIGIILRHGLAIGTPPPAAFVRITFAPMSAAGAALLGCMISATPGTTVIDIDLARREMVLHMLDTRDAAATVATIRRRFEAPLLAWFGAPA